MSEQPQSVSCPVIIFTQADADAAIKLITPKQLKKYDSILVVSSDTTVEDMPNFGYINISQLGRRKDNKKEKAIGAWKLRVPIIQLKLDDNTRHIFKVDSTCFQEKQINGHSYDTETQPE